MRGGVVRKALLVATLAVVATALAFAFGGSAGGDRGRSRPDRECSKRGDQAGNARSPASERRNGHSHDAVRVRFDARDRRTVALRRLGDSELRRTGRGLRRRCRRSDGRPGRGIRIADTWLRKPRLDGNTRVNQDCTFRRQAEEEIVYNPADPRNLVAGQNDSRVGFNQCGTDFSTNNGRNWGDELPPFRQRLNFPEGMGPSAANPNNNTIVGEPGTFHTYDAGSDPAVAVDSRGRAYFSCVVFDVASNASGLYVTQSPRGAKARSISTCRPRRRSSSWS